MMFLWGRLAAARGRVQRAPTETSPGFVPKSSAGACVVSLAMIFELACRTTTYRGRSKWSAPTMKHRSGLRRTKRDD
jgi:hypothetical protein